VGVERGALSLTRLQIQSQGPFRRRTSPSRSDAGAGGPAASLPDESESSTAQTVDEVDWLDITVPGAEKDRWAQELERAAKELFMQCQAGLWDCEMTEADKRPFQQEVLKQTAVHLGAMSDMVGNRAGEVYREEMRQYVASLALTGVQYGLQGASQVASLGKLSANTLSSLARHLYHHWTVGRHFSQY
jgi:hypothetical protein